VVPGLTLRRHPEDLQEHTGIEMQDVQPVQHYIFFPFLSYSSSPFLSYLFYLAPSLCLFPGSKVEARKVSNTECVEIKRVSYRIVYFVLKVTVLYYVVYLYVNGR